MQVSFARPSSETIKFANLYICGIPKQWTTKELETYFTSCGKIITSRILTDSNTGWRRGRESRCSFTYHFDRFCLILIWFQVSFARPSSDSIKLSNLYISNLPQSTTQQDLENLFADFGSIISSKILSCPKAGREPKPGDSPACRCSKTIPSNRQSFHPISFKVHQKASDLSDSTSDPKQKWRLVNLTVLSQRVRQSISIRFPFHRNADLRFYRSNQRQICQYTECCEVDDWSSDSTILFTRYSNTPATCSDSCTIDSSTIE